jgi:transposase InsO family protein
MNQEMTVDLVLDVLLMAIWRRKPVSQVLIHSDQGSQFTSGEWQSFLNANNLKASMSRRGDCHDNVVAESFFQLLKRERSCAKYTKQGRKPKTIPLITSKFFTTRYVSMVQTDCCRQGSMKTVSN